MYRTNQITIKLINLYSNNFQNFDLTNLAFYKFIVYFNPIQSLNFFFITLIF
jgi:hypothetical protein